MGWHHVSYALEVRGSMSAHNSQQDHDDREAWDKFLTDARPHIDAIKALADACPVINDTDEAVCDA